MTGRKVHEVYLTGRVYFILWKEETNGGIQSVWADDFTVKTLPDGRVVLTFTKHNTPTTVENIISFNFVSVEKAR